MTREEKVKHIQVEVFRMTNQKLGEYEIALILGNLIATEGIEESVEKATKKFDGSITRNEYSNLQYMTPWKLFIFRWGWGAYVISGMILLFLIITGVNTYREYQGKPNKLPYEYSRIQQLDDGRYFISKEDYTVIDGQGIIINP